MPCFGSHGVNLLADNGTGGTAGVDTLTVKTTARIATLGEAVGQPAQDGSCSVTVLGATGSIGQNTLDIISRHRKRFHIEALTAQTRVEELARLALLHGARLAVIGDESKYQVLKDLLSGSGIECAAGENAIVEAGARPADCVMAAIVGAAGLRPTFAAARQGRRIALANKECLVCAGDLFMSEVASANGQLIPVDSEHSGVFQCLVANPEVAAERIVLTASGGPFREWPLERLRQATVKEALKHPNWSMGDKVTIDSATMMNKGLELIEAFHLFPVTAEELDAVVHPQSIVHCLVTFGDGSVMAQLSAPDMRTPIAHALAWPARIAAPTERIDLTTLSGLTFEPVDDRRFPALNLARRCLKQGGTMACVLNGANEVAVEAFQNGQIGFLDITETVRRTLEEFDKRSGDGPMTSLDDVLAVDTEARRLAHQVLRPGV